MKGIIQKVSLPDDLANNMLAEIDKKTRTGKFFFNVLTALILLL
ncbi:MAG: hypothetical protein AAB653_01840 [Patescibacteria group bacterium]